MHKWHILSADINFKGNILLILPLYVLKNLHKYVSTIYRQNNNLLFQPSLANVCAQITNFFAPQFVYSKVVDVRMPFILMSIFGILASVLALFLPETNGIKLPDTIEEAEVLFKRKGLFSWKSTKVTPANEDTEK